MGLFFLWFGRFVQVFLHYFMLMYFLVLSRNLLYVVLYIIQDVIIYYTCIF